MGILIRNFQTSGDVSPPVAEVRFSNFYDLWTKMLDLQVLSTLFLDVLVK